MKFVLKALLLFAFVFGSSLTRIEAQKRSVDGQYIVRFNSEVNVSRARTLLRGQPFRIKEVLVPSLGIYSVESVTDMGVRHAVRKLSTLDSIRYAQADHYVTRRKTPNDPEFEEQWSLVEGEGRASHIGAQEAWAAHGVDGETYFGEEIVVAVVDGGVDVGHDDLKANMWVNKGEIPGNEIDDDENGYVDDVHGWNAYDDNGKLDKDRHGTHVAGTIGAVGDNGTHVTGVNWNVKVMGVGASSSQSSVVLKGYNYVLEQKQRYIDSRGREGANVVATNSSFGVDFADCTDGEFPAWNDVYDAMGKVGILSAVATANLAINVDEKGDVPTGCSSDYIVGVTNVTKTNVLFNSAGWGRDAIDLGAPGTAILSTVPWSGTQELTGTSMATPHVAGAIAYLHSVKNPNFAFHYRRNPAQAAKDLKEILITTVTLQDDLDGKSVSGGRLSLKKAADKMARFGLETVEGRPIQVPW